VVQSPGTDGEGLPLEAAPLMLSLESEPGVKFVCMYVSKHASESLLSSQLVSSSAPFTAHCNLPTLSEAAGFMPTFYCSLGWTCVEYFDLVYLNRMSFEFNILS